MYCGKCGTEITGNGEFCPKCGTAVSAVQTTEPPKINTERTSIPSNALTSGSNEKKIPRFKHVTWKTGTSNSFPSLLSAKMKKSLLRWATDTS